MKINVAFQDEERAGGTIAGEGSILPWTAIKSPAASWYIVLHGAVERDSSLARAFTRAIADRVALSKAA